MWVRSQWRSAWVGSLVGFGAAAFAAAWLLLPVAAEARAQDSQAQQSSVADAARKAKQKKNAAGKASKVIDDDNLGSNLKSGGPDVTNVGASAAATVNPGAAANGQAGANGAAASGDAAAKDSDAGSAKPADSGAAGQDDASAKDSDAQDAELAKVKAQVEATQQELDLLKRGFALDSEAYYSRTGYSSDKAGKAKLDDEQQQIGDKQQELEQVKARLAELQEQRGRRKAKGAAAPASETEKPPQQ